MTAISNLPMTAGDGRGSLLVKEKTMNETQREEITAAADEAWAAYTSAIQAVQRAPLDWDSAELERLWLAAEMAANTVRRLAEVAR